MSQRTLWCWCVVVLCALLGLAFPVGALQAAEVELRLWSLSEVQTPPVTEAVPLRLRPLSDGEMQVLQGATIVDLDPGPAERLTAQPAYVGATPRFGHYLLPGPGEDRILAMVFDRSGPDAPAYDVVYIDRDNDNDLAEEAPLRIVRQKSFEALFEPVTLTFLTGREVGSTMVRVRTLNLGRGGAPSAVFLWPAGCLEGATKLGGGERRVALVDVNMNGLFDDVWTPTAGGDRLLVDVNGDGRYDLKGSFPEFSSDEVRPFSHLWQVAGKWWEVRVVQDGSSLTWTPSEVEMGELRYRGPEVRMLVSSQRYGWLPVTLTEGTSAFPADEWTPRSARLTALDDRGRKWVVLTSEAKAQVRVARGSPGELDFSKPLVGSVTVATSIAGEVGISLTLATAAEARVLSVSVDDDLPPKPALTITDASGAEVAAGNFEYG